MQRTEIRARLLSDGSIPLSLSLSKFGDYLKNEIAKWGNVVRVSRARVD